MDTVAPRSGPEFVDYLRSLAGDFRSKPEDWQNRTVDSFLAAIAQYMDDTEGNWEEFNFEELAGLFAVGRHRDE